MDNVFGNVNVGIISWEQKNVVIKKIVPGHKIEKNASRGKQGLWGFRQLAKA